MVSSRTDEEASRNETRERRGEKGAIFSRNTRFEILFFNHDGPFVTNPFAGPLIERQRDLRFGISFNIY